MSEEIRNILVVDDDEYDRLAMARALENSRYALAVDMAVGGNEALAALKNRDYHAIITDFQLPDITADQLVVNLAPQIRNGLAIIVVAGVGDIRKAAKVLRDGAHDYLVKDDVNAERIELALSAAWRTVELNMELERQRLELLRSNRELEQYAVLASHDLRQPLRTVHGFLDLLREHAPDLDHTANRYLRQAMEGAKQMSVYVDGLLQIAKLRHQPDAFAAFSSEEVVAMVLSGLQDLARSAKATYTFGTLPTQFGTEHQFHQVLQNLITNALLHRDKTRAPTIEVAARYERPLPLSRRSSSNERMGFWRWSVTDNGPGVAEVAHESIFDMFQRADSSSSGPGSGIGLAVCRKIVETHGGQIYVDSDHHDGLRICFTWPGPIAVEQAQVG
ncbi:MAG: ATP-binding protein [Pseudomonadota bacterium]